jgi:hypothetical protein
LAFGGSFLLSALAAAWFFLGKPSATGKPPSPSDTAIKFTESGENIVKGDRLFENLVRPPDESLGGLPATPKPIADAPSGVGSGLIGAEAADGPADKPIRLKITLRTRAPGGALVSLQGVPKDAKLSKGIEVGGGQWLINPAELKDLTAFVPARIAGRYPLTAQLLKDDASTAISDAAAFTLTARGASSATRSLGDAAPETDFLTQTLINDGHKKMREGDILAARKLYEQAAASGNAEAALSMGRSYDPSYFEKLSVKTGKPDPATAFEWYKQALEGGSTTAKVRIDALKTWLQK